MSDRNPILLSLYRGSTLESWHRGAVVAIGSAGETLMAAGDPASQVMLRSVGKPFQTLAALNSGVVAAWDLTPSDVAIMSASHNAEPRHLEAVESLLRRGGFTQDDLQCGTHPSLNVEVTEQLARAGVTRTAIHSNCSGKHAGMLLFARHIQSDPERYLAPDHAIQQRILATITRVMAATPSDTAVDGCSAPTYPLPLHAVADAFRKLANPEQADAADRDGLRAVRDAMTAEPFLVGGSKRFDSDLMLAGGGRFVAKIGAEGLIGCGVVDAGIGIAVAIDDGAARGYEPVLLETLDRLGLIDRSMRASLYPYFDCTLRNFRGREVGRREVTL